MVILFYLFYADFAIYHLWHPFACVFWVSLECLNPSLECLNKGLECLNTSLEGLNTGLECLNTGLECLNYFGVTGWQTTKWGIFGGIKSYCQNNPRYLYSSNGKTKTRRKEDSRQSEADFTRADPSTRDGHQRSHDTNRKKDTNRCHQMAARCGYTLPK